MRAGKCNLLSPPTKVGEAIRLLSTKTMSSGTDKLAKGGESAHVKPDSRRSV